MSNRLPVLADIANSAHEYTAIALRAAAESAREAGEALLEAKALVPYGEWEAWLKGNFKGGSRTAQRYMRIAKRWPSITEKTSRVSYLSVNEALRLLEARDDLAEAQALQAEADALRHELDFLASAMEIANPEGLRFIIARSAEIHALAADIRSRSIREMARIAKELETAA
ncbi:hypothetical protein IE4872_CH01604 [Rhizobium gallicum]|uniref:DUF3102 domain-containing protein n=1 Tax=Rhizobium gallicum TaxID=56730 RepID=A0A1L5NH38_9HYPH|nr:DUF3102 domain-containing protein [Rhizobium gallicum]APO67246.1 hypothetical protein IE4872_CH01604 [Rhizobium gallicum]